MSDREIDQQLAERAQSGDKRAFELLVPNHQRKVERLLSLIRDQAEIEDVAQESFIKAYRALVGFRAIRRFTRGFYRIAVNTAKITLSPQGKVPRRPPISTPRKPRGFEDAVGLRDIATPGCRAWRPNRSPNCEQHHRQAPEELRTAITLQRRIDGFRTRKSPKLLDCPIGTVRLRGFSGHARLWRKSYARNWIFRSDRRW